MVQRRASTKGFKRTASLLTGRIRAASESRGFAQSRLLTDWAEIAGTDVAAVSRPVEVSYGRGGMGATLTLLTTGAQAPMLEMQKDQLRTKVNAVYGYNAIARIRITQTAATGFAEGQVAFTHKPKDSAPADPAPETKAQACSVVAPVADDGLRAALERLGAHILTKEKQGKST
ncbi:MAG: DciA family protein [Pseudomonadota bacterium]